MLVIPPNLHFFDFETLDLFSGFNSGIKWEVNCSRVVEPYLEGSINCFNFFYDATCHKSLTILHPIWYFRNTGKHAKFEIRAFSNSANDHDQHPLNEANKAHENKF